jgi:hypothetical protein
MIIEEITIESFMKAWFKDDYSELSKENFEIAYTEYIDVSGLSITQEFDLIANIYYLTNRLNVINLAVDLHKSFLEHFDTPYPYEDGYQSLEEYGHYLLWMGDKEQHLQELDRILSSEGVTQAELNGAKKQLEDFRKQASNGEKPDIKQTREQFLRMITSLQKLGYNIRRKETYVEELALIISQQREEVSNGRKPDEVRF